MTKCRHCNKNFNSERSLEQHVRAKHGTLKSRFVKKLTKAYKTYSILLVIIIIVILTSYYAILSQLSFSQYDDFAKCLTNEGFIMAGTDWCSSCRAQKTRFGSSFKYINYKNCDDNELWCRSNKIQSYPTWILPNNNKMVGVKPLASLSELSVKCNL
ncbi:hypothetical protein GF352_03935 [archaeon]|nr:hypothetical protein [archaeon]